MTKRTKPPARTAPKPFRFIDFAAI